MASFLAEEGLTELNERFPCRERQTRHLALLLSPEISNPPTIVVHGSEATGKSSIVRELLKTSALPHAIVPSQECITGRHLLERTLATCLEGLAARTEEVSNSNLFTRTENISALAAQLQRLLASHNGHFILVLDGVDRQREAPPTLLPALARFGELIPNLTIILIVTNPRPRFLHATGVPYIYFPPYTREQSLQIVSRDPLRIFTEPSPPDVNYTEKEAAEDDVWVWTRFCAVVWDSLAKGAARDVVSFRAAIEKLWRPFVSSIVDGTYGTRDFSRLLVAKRALFQGDAVLVDNAVPRSPKTGADAVASLQKTHDLPYYSKYLLCATYLASYNSAREDTLFFMRATERKRRKRGGATIARKAAKHGKIKRRLLGPQAFVLERLLGIFHAILPHPVVPTADILIQISTLTSLRLIVRTGGTSIDALEASAKWRVNVSWEFVHHLARSAGLEIADYMIE